MQLAPLLTLMPRLISLLLVITVIMSSGYTPAAWAQATPNASPMATPEAEGPTLTFKPVADAYVVQSTPDENYGERATLISDQDLMSIAYIQFDLTGVDSQVVSAKIRLWVTDPTISAPVLWLSPPAPLDEGGITWNTRPALDEVVDVKDGEEVEEGAWLEYDVSSVISGDGVYVFAVMASSTDGMDFVSREAEANEEQPELVVVLTGERQGSGGHTGQGDAPILLAAGDIALCDTEGAEQTAQILDKQAGTIAALGDNAYTEGTAEQFDACYDPTWGRHKDRTMPVPGNHEYYTADAAPYFEYFGDAAGNPNEGYYSYALGSWKIIAINTNIQIEPDSDQMEWLRTQLEGSVSECTLVYGHHPRFSSGYQGSNDDMDPFFRLFYDYGVELYLAGHDHSYERFRPQNPAGERDDAYGVRQFVIGTGGTSLRPFTEIAANSEVRTADALGIARFRLSDSGYEWEFLAAGDATFYDSGEADCHDAPDKTLSAENRLHRQYAPIAGEPRRLSWFESGFSPIYI